MPWCCKTIVVFFQASYEMCKQEVEETGVVPKCINLTTEEDWGKIA